MRTHVLRRPIVFLRVRCSILILLKKTVCCSIRSLYHTALYVPLATLSSCSPKFLLTSHPHWWLRRRHDNWQFHDTARLSMKSASSSKILLSTHTASHPKKHICIEAVMSDWSRVGMSCVMRPFVTNFFTANLLSCSLLVSYTSATNLNNKFGHRYASRNRKSQRIF